MGDAKNAEVGEVERGEKARLGRRAGSRRRGRKEVNKPCGTSEGANGLARDPRDPRRCWPLPQGEEPIIGPHPQASSGPGSHLLGPWGEVPTPATMEDMFGAATGPAPLERGHLRNPPPGWKGSPGSPPNPWEVSARCWSTYRWHDATRGLPVYS